MPNSQLRTGGSKSVNGDDASRREIDENRRKSATAQQLVEHAEHQLTESGLRSLNGVRGSVCCLYEPKQGDPFSPEFYSITINRNTFPYTGKGNSGYARVEREETGPEKADRLTRLQSDQVAGSAKRGASVRVTRTRGKPTKPFLRA